MAAGGAEDELPKPDEKIIDDVLLARLGGDAYEATRSAPAWCSLDAWQPPAPAVLCRSAQVRRRHAPTLLPACRDLAALKRHDLTYLAYALAVLDDEPPVVLHRPSGTRFEVRIGGIGDTFQLHTLLAHVLIGGGHVPGATPSAESVRLATNPEPARGRCACRIPHPHWSGHVLVLMEGTAKSCSSSYVQMGDPVRVLERSGQRAEGAGVRKALVRPVLVVERLELAQGIQEMTLVPDQRAVQQ
ncbi:hypothetical protein ACWGQ5_51410, partial [Streptomyces sp. NPDC055722]